MPWCPKCLFEYQTGITICADCGSELTEQNPLIEAVDLRGRRSCAHYGCITVSAFVLFMALWIASGFFIWKKCKINLPDGSGSVIYMAKMNKIYCAEWDRKVHIVTNKIHSKSRWLPGDGGGADPVNVYWYPTTSGKGPYLRFNDPICEYLVDLKSGITYEIYGNADIGEISSKYPAKRRCIEDPTTGLLVVTIDGHPMKKLEPSVASSKGIYLGRIEYI